MKANLKRLIGTCFIYAFMMVIPFSCNVDLLCNNSCGCDPLPQASPFEVKSLAAATYDITGKEVTSDDFFPYDQVYKQISIKDYQFITQIEPTPLTGSIPGVAYACSIAPPSSVNRLIGITIYNLKEVELGDGTILKVGDELNDFFEINSFYDNSSRSIDDFFMEPQLIFLDEKLRLFFTKDPEKETVIEFSIQFLFEKNQELVINSTLLKIS